jgi:hypothetical protein
VPVDPESLVNKAIQELFSVHDLDPSAMYKKASASFITASSFDESFMDFSGIAYLRTLKNLNRSTTSMAEVSQGPQQQQPSSAPGSRQASGRRRASTISLTVTSAGSKPSTAMGTSQHQLSNLMAADNQGELKSPVVHAEDPVEKFSASEFVIMLKALLVKLSLQKSLSEKRKVALVVQSFVVSSTTAFLRKAAQHLAAVQESLVASQKLQGKGAPNAGKGQRGASNQGGTAASGDHHANSAGSAATVRIPTNTQGWVNYVWSDSVCSLVAGEVSESWVWNRKNLSNPGSVISAIDAVISELVSQGFDLSAIPLYAVQLLLAGNLERNVALTTLIHLEAALALKRIGYIDESRAQLRLSNLLPVTDPHLMRLLQARKTVSEADENEALLSVRKILMPEYIVLRTADALLNLGDLHTAQTYLNFFETPSDEANASANSGDSSASFVRMPLRALYDSVRAKLCFRKGDFVGGYRNLNDSLQLGTGSGGALMKTLWQSLPALFHEPVEGKVVTRLQHLIRDLDSLRASKSNHLESDTIAIAMGSKATLRAYLLFSSASYASHTPESDFKMKAEAQEIITDFVFALKTAIEAEDVSLAFQVLQYALHSLFALGKAHVGVRRICYLHALSFSRRALTLSQKISSEIQEFDHSAHSFLQHGLSSPTASTSGVVNNGIKTALLAGHASAAAAQTQQHPVMQPFPVGGTTSLANQFSVCDTDMKLLEANILLGVIQTPLQKDEVTMDDSEISIEEKIKAFVAGPEDEDPLLKDWKWLRSTGLELVADLIGPMYSSATISRSHRAQCALALGTCRYLQIKSHESLAAVQEERTGADGSVDSTHNATESASLGHVINPPHSARARSAGRNLHSAKSRAGSVLDVRIQLLDECKQYLQESLTYFLETHDTNMIAKSSEFLFLLYRRLHETHFAYE